MKEENSITISQANEPNQAKLTWRIKLNQSDISMKGVLLLDKILDNKAIPFPKYFDYLIQQLSFYKVIKFILLLFFNLLF